jgi:hypothetical protein
MLVSANTASADTMLIETLVFTGPAVFFMLFALV